MNSEIMSELAAIKKLLEEHNTPGPMSLTDAAAYLHLSKSYLYGLTSRGEIAVHRPGGKRLFFRRSDLDNWAYKNRQKSPEELQEEARRRLKR